MSTVSLKHSIDGRLRLKITSVKNSETTATAVEELLNAQNAVKHCRANPLTGSVIIKYDSDMATGETFLQLLKEEGFFEGSPANEDHIQTVNNNSEQSIAGIIFTKAIEIAAERAILALL